ncbi:aminoacyl-histidine dipeptidase [Zooshikella ganghwensis]|uniref:aminoacyl-histidine dipeptidase n=1 Tax=Zooshikella ganghwensis TaxID=202772 RepID=UPI0003F96615|nr:aminoacyl-histidine dipeptidase [Zooshikella ganghwensis]
MNAPHLTELQPSSLWQHFAKICSIPHPSGYEAQLAEHIQHWATDLGLSVTQDHVGNLIIRKPATSGLEHAPGVVLQAHLDMVPQKNSTTQHDFTKDPINAYIEGDWVTAENTTLGADNGIGVSAILAVLESTHLQHGPIEALFTIDEESGMTGAMGLQPGQLQGSILLNLDSEDEGELYLGCAGGVDICADWTYSPEPVPADYQSFELAITGLKGGHSGVDIHLGRANANKLMARLLCEADQAELPIRVSHIQGGSLRNAIPREAFIKLACPNAAVMQLKTWQADQQAILNNELQHAEPDLQLTLSEIAPLAQLMPAASQKTLSHTLSACPHGVMRMSDTVQGIVESSTNLGVITVEDGRIHVASLARSLIDSAGQALANAVANTFRLANATIRFEGAYPGWQPNMQSSVLQTMIGVHQRLFEVKPEIKVIHAGLECGLLAAAYPHWDMISFGPTIRYPHSPDEKVNIHSVQRFWDLLVATLKAIATEQ